MYSTDMAKFTIEPHPLYGWYYVKTGGHKLAGTKFPNEYDWYTKELPGVTLVASEGFKVKYLFPDWKLQHWEPTQEA